MKNKLSGGQGVMLGGVLTALAMTTAHYFDNRGQETENATPMYAVSADMNQDGHDDLYVRTLAGQHDTIMLNIPEEGRYVKCFLPEAERSHEGGFTEEPLEVRCDVPVTDKNFKQTLTNMNQVFDQVMQYPQG